MANVDWLSILREQTIRVRNAAEDAQRVLDDRSVTVAKAVKVRSIIARAAEEFDKLIAGMDEGRVDPRLERVAMDIAELWAVLDAWAAGRLNEMERSSPDR